MHQRKSSKKKVFSTFATSAILAVCLLPGGAHAQEEVVQKEQVQHVGFETTDGKTYYFDPNNDYKMAKDWFKVGENWYRTNEDGALNKGTLNWASEKYFFDKETGKSLFSIRKNGNKYYGYGPEGNNATLIQGFQEFDGKKYYFGEGIENDGTGLAKGEMAKDWKYIDGNWYCFNSDGVMETGWKKGKYKFDFTGTYEYYYLNSDGKMASGLYRTVNGEEKFFNVNGKMGEFTHISTHWG